MQERRAAIQRLLVEQIRRNVIADGCPLDDMKMSAPELALRFGCTTRTIYRDLRYLRLLSTEAAQRLESADMEARRERDRVRNAARAAPNPRLATPAAPIPVQGMAALVARTWAIEDAVRRNTPLTTPLPSREEAPAEPTQRPFTGEDLAELRARLRQQRATGEA